MSSGSSPSIQEHERDEAGYTLTPTLILGFLRTPKQPRRVDAVTANMENRCLITNCLSHHAANYAHVLSRAAKDSELTRLEFSWGMRRGTLSVDTHFNDIRLRKDVNALLDKGGFILLPEDDVVEKYRDGGNPDFNGDRMNNVYYKCTPVASPETDGYPIHRSRFPAQPGQSRGPVNFLYPFAGFPALQSLLQSHAHPCFAICHAGRFKPNLYQYFSSTSHDLYIRLSKVMFTYSQWTAAQLSVEFLNDPKLPTDRDDASYRRSLRLQNKDNRRQYQTPRSPGFTSSRGRNFSAAYIQAQAKFVRDWASSVVGQTFVEDDTMVSQKNQTYDDKGVNAFEGLHYTPPDISVN